MRVYFTRASGLALSLAFASAVFAQGPEGGTAAPAATAPVPLLKPGRYATMSRVDDRGATLDRRVAPPPSDRPVVRPAPNWWPRRADEGRPAGRGPSDYLTARVEAHRLIPGERPGDIMREM